MGELRKPFFLIALIAVGLVVLVELGSSLFLGGHDAGQALLTEAAKRGINASGASDIQQPPGRGIPYLALIDVIAFYTVALMGASLIVPKKLHGRLQGVLTLIGSIVLIIVSLILLIIAFIELLIMVGLFFAFPFGTIAYLAIWGFFPRGDAAVILSLLMFLKLVFAGFLILAQPRFLQNKGLVALIVTSLVANIVVAFLHGFVPIILVSIVDDLAAVIFASVDGDRVGDQLHRRAGPVDWGEPRGDVVHGDQPGISAGPGGLRAGSRRRCGCVLVLGGGATASGGARRVRVVSGEDSGSRRGAGGCVLVAGPGVLGRYRARGGFATERAAGVRRRRVGEAEETMVALCARRRSRCRGARGRWLPGLPPG